MGGAVARVFKPTPPPAPAPGTPLPPPQNEAAPGASSSPELISSIACGINERKYARWDTTI